MREIYPSKTGNWWGKAGRVFGAMALFINARAGGLGQIWPNDDEGSRASGVEPNPDTQHRCVHEE